MRRGNVGLYFFMGTSNHLLVKNNMIALKIIKNDRGYNVPWPKDEETKMIIALKK